MTHAEQAYASQQGDMEERNRLIMQELPQVNFIARRIHERLPQHVPFEDLVNAGVIGLIDALKSYDPGKGVQLRAFTQFRIRGAILDSLRELDWGSRRLRHKGRQIEEKVLLLEAKLGRKPSDDELAAEVGMSLEQLQSVLAQLDGLELLGQQVDSHIDRNESQDLIESAPANEEESPFEVLAQSELKEQLAKAVSQLSSKEQLVLSLYYKDELTMREVAAVLDITQSRVSQLHASALLKLRTTLRTKAAKSK
jgi:RNA polymerase sigma factor for flagellar operon FliA